MKIGTKSVLFGGHQFLIHPWFVAWGWIKVYGLGRIKIAPGLRTSIWDPRLWVAFFVHDFGYIGKPNMDGEEGETHPVLGARIISWLFDRPRILETRKWCALPDGQEWEKIYADENKRWYNFVLTHSRFYAKQLNLPISKLCLADKMAIALTPSWLFVPMARATGEIHEYRSLATVQGNPTGRDEYDWHRGVQDYCTKYVEEHKDGKEDTWTGSRRGGVGGYENRIADDKGVWQ